MINVDGRNLYSDIPGDLRKMMYILASQCSLYLVSEMQSFIIDGIKFKGSMQLINAPKDVHFVPPTENDFLGNTLS